MGQGKSTANNSPLYNPSEYQESNSFFDDRYGNMKLIINKLGNQNFAVLSQTLQDENELKSRIGVLNFRQALNHPHLTKLVRFNSTKQDELCSSFYSLNLLYEYWTNNLQFEIAERQRIGVPYKEGEIWYLAETVLSVVEYLKKQGLSHQDIRPYNILFTESGTVKVGEIFLNNRQIPAFTQIANHTLQQYYISPQLFSSLRDLHQLPVYDSNKAEIYSVGMTLLEAATLENVTNTCYDTTNFTVKQDEVNRLLQQVNDEYSGQLASFIQKLLTEAEVARPNVEDLLFELKSQYVQSKKVDGVDTIIILPEDAQYAQQAQQQEANNFDLEGPIVPEPPPNYVKEVQIVKEAPFVNDERVTRAPAGNISQSTQNQNNTQNSQVLPNSQYNSQQPQYNNNNNNYVSTTSQKSYIPEDLDARIQRVLAMSRETIARYGVPNNSVVNSYPQNSQQTQVNTYTQGGNNVAEPKASQIQTRTFLNQNTNIIETQNYQGLEDGVKRATNAVNYDNVQTVYNQQAPQSVQQQQYTYTLSNPDTTGVSNSQNLPRFSSERERDAYISRVVSQSQVNQINNQQPVQQVNTQITYNSYLDNVNNANRNQVGNYQTVTY